MLPTNFIPWAWAISALVIAYIELHAPGFYLIWIACAAAIVSIITFSIDLSLSSQLLVFAISCSFTCLAGHFIYRHLMLPREGDSLLNRRTAELIGTVGIVSEPFRNGQGKIKLGGIFWLAEGPENLENGTSVTVIAVNGTKLIVSGSQ